MHEGANVLDMPSKLIRENGISTNSVQTPTYVIHDDEDQLAVKSDYTKLLLWNYQLGYLSFLNIKLLALLGTIPWSIDTVRPPKYAGFIFRAIPKCPWCTKANKNGRTIKAVTTTGSYISVNQLKSTAPGFIS